MVLSHEETRNSGKPYPGMEGEYHAIEWTSCKAIALISGKNTAKSRGERTL